MAESPGRALLVAELLRDGWTADQVSVGLKVIDGGGSALDAMAAMKATPPEAKR